MNSQPLVANEIIDYLEAHPDKIHRKIPAPPETQ
jgi:hypothetical protein